MQKTFSPSRAAFLYDASRALNLRYISVLQFKGFNERDSNIVSFRSETPFFNSGSETSVPTCQSARTMKKRAEITSVEVKAKVLTLKEVSDYLRVSRVTIYRMLKRGEIPAFRVAGNWRFNIEDLGHWIERESRAGGPKDSRKPSA